jgi:hypothetical protein
MKVAQQATRAGVSLHDKYWKNKSDEGTPGITAVCGNALI